MKVKGMNTQSVHAGEENKVCDAVVQPIFQTATYMEHEGLAYNDIKYLRLNNSPNHESLGQKIACLEQTEAALLCSSGMAAITTAILSVCKSGDHIIAQKGVYGGTYNFLVHKAPRLGIEVSFVDINAQQAWQEALQDNTVLMYCESIANPLMQTGNLEHLIEFCKHNNLSSMIDNTFATPYNFKPSSIGFDYIVHSATKYLNGHSDLVAGAICASKDYIIQCKSYLDIYGATLDPNACFLLQRGLKTFGLRMQAHNSNALKLAEFLAQHPKIEKVYYPGLEESWAKQNFEGCSGMLAFEITGDQKSAQTFLKQLKIAQHAPSLGGVESLITRPAASSHASMTEEERLAIGIKQNLIRLSVGIEDIQDLIEDIEISLAKI